jgi:acetoin utilization protein AcuB
MTTRWRVAPLGDPIRHPRPWEELEEDPRVVAEVVYRVPTVVSPQAKASEAEQLLGHLAVHHLPVVDEAGGVVGILCSCDLRAAEPETQVIDCMSAPPVTVDGAVPLARAAEMIRELNLGALLVLEETRLLGLVTRGDLRRAGVFSDEDHPRCRVCRTRHHVRVDLHAGRAVCLSCRERMRQQALYDEDGKTGGD